MALIVGYGNPVMDVIAPATQEDLKALGLTRGVDAPPISEDERERVIEFCQQQALESLSL